MGSRGTRLGSFRPRTTLALSAVLLCGAIGLLKGEADTRPPPPGGGAAPRVEVIPDAARAFVADHCIRCHNGDRKVANLDLTSPAYDPADAGNFALWVRVHDRVATGAMPPEGAKQPDAAKRGAFVAGLAETFVASERRLLAGEGRSTRRRMNRLEYENALRDLLGVPTAQLAAQLPEDGE